ncbi:MAG: hypothetical protein NTY65_00550 [Planctomycetota bacterium]|nr:hypothetical protein [Planctomycetota bacterium]
MGGFWWGEGDEKLSVGGEKERGPGIGDEYDGMIAGVKKQLANLKTDFPALADRGYEIAGFGWHQGWQDGCSMADTLAYEKNMVNFIKDVRKDLGVPTLPFVIGGSGFGGWEQKVDRRLKIMEAQNAVADLPEFKDTVRYVETRSFYRPPEESPSKYRYHWNDNAGIFGGHNTDFLIALSSVGRRGTLRMLSWLPTFGVLYREIQGRYPYFPENTGSVPVFSMFARANALREIGFCFMFILCAIVIVYLPRITPARRPAWYQSPPTRPC